jgi:hypothetical protein
MGGDTFERHHFADLLAQHRVTLGSAILQGVLSPASDLISGLAATVNSARISEATISRARSAYCPT